MSLISSRVSDKGQVTLPRKIRQTLNVKPGDRVLFLVDDQKVVLQALTGYTVRALGGSLKQYGRRRAAASARTAVKKEVARAARQEG